jgi:hypothetical protein
MTQDIIIPRLHHPKYFVRQIPQQKINLHHMYAYDLLQVYDSQVNHPASEMEDLDDPDDITNDTPSDTPSDDADSRLVYAATSSRNSKLPPGYICLHKDLSTKVNI